MKITLLLTLLLLCVSVACHGQSAGDSRTAMGVSDNVGVNVDFIEPKRGELKMIASAGFRWVRVEFKWELTEKAKGSYDFAPY